METPQEEVRVAIAQRAARDARLGEILKNDDDLISLVLRGHLVAEEVLYAAVAAHCPRPEHLSSARLRFPQLVSLLQSLEKIPVMPGHLWQALRELNRLRNALTHQIEPRELKERVEAFARLVLADSSEASTLPDTPREHLRGALLYLLGAMGMLAVFQEATEALIRHHLSQLSPQQQGDLPNKAAGAGA